MKLKKAVAFVSAAVMMATTTCTSLLSGVLAAESVKTVEPFPFTIKFGETKKMMFPGNAFWVDTIWIDEWTPAQNDGYEESQHVLSQYAEIGTPIRKETDLDLGMAGFRYIPLDVPLNLDENGQHEEGKFDNSVPPMKTYESKNETQYRDAVYYGTFLGTRIDRAIFPEDMKKGLYESFRVASGSYVATSMLLSGWWLSKAGDPNYADIDQIGGDGWRFETSADGVTWTEVEIPEGNVVWENGTKGSDVAGYYSVTVGFKMPEGHSYYRVLTPSKGEEDIRDAKAFSVGIGPTKVSSTPMVENGEVSEGSPYQDFYGAVSTEEDLVSFDFIQSKVFVTANYDVKVQQVLDRISGNVVIKNTDGTDADPESMITTGMKMSLRSADNNEKMVLAIEKTNCRNTAIAPNDPKRPLYPGVVDWIKTGVDVNKDQYNKYYSDYANLVGGTYLSKLTNSEVNYNVRYGIFMGQNNTAAYGAYDTNGEKSVVYKVLPETYMATSLIIHPWAVKTTDEKLDGAKMLEIAQSFGFYSSPDGENWTKIETKPEDFSFDHGKDGQPVSEILGFTSMTCVVKIPANHKYYKVQIGYSKVQDHNYCYVGPTKASRTDMHNGEPGDEEVPWYELPDISVKDENIVINEQEKTVNVKAYDEMTLKQFAEKLQLTALTMKIFDKSGTEITDMSKILETGMVLKFYTTGQDAKEYIALNVTFTKVERPKDPGIEVKDSSILSIDEVDKVIRLKKDGLTLQQVLDALVLNGGVEVYFYDAEDNLIEDMNTVVSKGMYASLFTSALLGEYKILLNNESDGDLDGSETGDGNIDNGPSTGEQSMIAFASILLLSAGAGVLFLKRRKTINN